MAPYQMPPKLIRPPLIPPEDDTESEEASDGLFCSAAKLIINTGSSMAEIIVGLFTSFSGRKKTHYYPRQETFLIPEEDAPPLEPRSRAPPLKRSYPFMTYGEVERSENSGQIHGPGSSKWVGENRLPHHEPHQQKPVPHRRQQQHQQR